MEVLLKYSNSTHNQKLSQCEGEGNQPYLYISCYLSSPGDHEHLHGH